MPVQRSSYSNTNNEVLLQPQQLPAAATRKVTSGGEGKAMTKKPPGKDGDARESRPRIGSTLSVRETNTRGGSKSSVSSQDGEFFTAAKDKQDLARDNYKKSKVYRNSTKSYNKENLPRTKKQVPPSAPVIPFTLIINNKVAKVKDDHDDQPGSVPEVNGVTKVEEEVLDCVGASASPELKEVAKVQEDQEEDEIFEDAVPALPDGVLSILIDEGLYEYSQEVYVYLKSSEDPELIPRDFLNTGSVDSNMRRILVDWIIQVQHHLKLSQESLYVAINILDTVLAKRDVGSDKLQLVGVTSLFMATKLEEYYPAEIKKLLHLTENSYTRTEMLNMERILLHVLNFKVRINPNFLSPVLSN